MSKKHTALALSPHTLGQMTAVARVVGGLTPAAPGARCRLRTEMWPLGTGWSPRPPTPPLSRTPRAFLSSPPAALTGFPGTAGTIQAWQSLQGREQGWTLLKLLLGRGDPGILSQFVFDVANIHSFNRDFLS